MPKSLLDTDIFSEILKGVDQVVVQRATDYRAAFGRYTISAPSMVPDERVRAEFINSLFSAVADERSRLRVVITLRADFYDRPLLYLPASELFGRRTEVVGPLAA